ncbi:MAG: hypothetical protein J5637_08180 [Prevotella sp.]|nr:hypothetical protein [Prevotella sp.]
MQTALSIFLFLLAIAYVEYRLKSIRKDDHEDKKDAFDFFATKEELKKAVKKINEQAAEYQNAIDEKLTSVEQKVFFTPQVEEKATEVVEEEPDPSVIFFRWPGDDGTFDDRLRLPAQTEDTYYLFRLDDSRTHAEFLFVTMSDTQLSKANNSSKKYIERACTFVNAKSAQYVCTPGKAHLERGKWVIDLKARIEYR